MPEHRVTHRETKNQNDSPQHFLSLQFLDLVNLDMQGAVGRLPAFVVGSTDDELVQRVKVDPDAGSDTAIFLAEPLAPDKCFALKNNVYTARHLVPPPPWFVIVERGGDSFREIVRPGHGDALEAYHHGDAGRNELRVRFLVNRRSIRGRFAGDSRVLPFRFRAYSTGILRRLQETAGAIEWFPSMLVNQN